MLPKPIVKIRGYGAKLNLQQWLVVKGISIRSEVHKGFLLDKNQQFFLCQTFLKEEVGKFLKS